MFYILSKINSSKEKRTPIAASGRESWVGIVDDFKHVVYKFTLGKKTFDMIIGEQRCVFNKQGLGFKPTLKQNLLANRFVKASSSSYIICHNCNNHGYTSSDCRIKKSMSHG